ncbi:MAG: hypothetical protein AABX32_03130, partial [Nanoarchaeota archaeon]
VNFSNIADLNERYYYNVTIRDRVNFVNSTETRVITLDNTTPAISLNSPVNNTLTINNTISFNFTVTETNIKNCSLYANFSGTFQENFTNSSPANGTHNIITPTAIADGLYAWNVKCYDLAENNAFNSTNFTLDIDTTPPAEFNLLEPVNNTESINRSPRLNWAEAIDAHFLNYTVLVDNNIDFSSIDFVYKLGGNSSNNTLEVPDQWTGNTQWHWKVIAYDVLNQSRNSSGYFSYIIDNSTPQISLLLPFNHSVENQSLVSFSFNVTDLFTVANCSLIINNQIKSTSTSITKNISNAISFNLANGNYNWSINCTDKAGNINSSAFRNLTVNAPALLPTIFIDTYTTDFDRGALHLTNITEADSLDETGDTNVTLNYTIINTFKVYNISGNFTSRIYDTGANNTRLQAIKWSSNLPTSSDVMGFALDNPGNNMTALYRNGTHRMSTGFVTDLLTNKDLTGYSFTYSLPAGMSSDDIVGVSVNDDGNDMVVALLKNGSAIRTADMGVNTLGQDLPFTVVSTYTIPAGFNSSDIIGFAIDTSANGGAGQSAVFFKNRSYVMA